MKYIRISSAKYAVEQVLFNPFLVWVRP